MDASTIGIILGVAGIIVGIVVSYYFYRKSLRIKEPCVAFKTNNLIRGYVSKLENLEILYKGQKVENLTVAKVLLWNNGADTINGQDITNVDPLRIVGVGKTKVLDAKILSSNSATNQLSCTLDDSTDSIHIGFDYLDQGQGGVIQIVHTGLSRSDIQIQGTIKGVASLKIKRVYFNDMTPEIIARKVSTSTRRLFSAIFYIFGGVFFTLFGGSGLLLLIAGRVPKAQPLFASTSTNNLFYYLIIPLMLVTGIVLLWSSVRIWRIRPPKGLEIFESESHSE